MSRRIISTSLAPSDHSSFSATGAPLTLRVTARYIKNGTVKFPRTGREHLLTQLLGFDVVQHDDAVDALVYLILGLVGDGIEEQKVHYV
jgi:hypothetical protein